MKAPFPWFGGKSKAAEVLGRPAASDTLPLARRRRLLRLAWGYRGDGRLSCRWGLAGGGDAVIGPR